MINPSPLEISSDTVQRFLSARTVDDIRTLLAVHPELCSPDADKALTDRMLQAEREGNKSLADMVVERRDLLRLCMLVGIVDGLSRWEAAHSEKTDTDMLRASLIYFLNTTDWQEMRTYLEHHLELLTPEAEEMLASFIQQASVQGDEKLLQLLKEHQSFLHRCYVMDIDQAYDQMGYR